VASAPVTTAPAARRFSTSTADVELPSGPWGDLDSNQAKVVRTIMLRTRAGREVLRAVRENRISLTFTNEDAPNGNPGGTRGTTARVYLKVTQRGRSYTVGYVRKSASEAEYAAAIAVHEGIHALGLRGSKRAELYCRLQEMKLVGFEIDSAVQQETRQFIYREPVYANLPDTIGCKSDSFPGVEC
jgi:hypothetical protein